MRRLVCAVCIAWLAASACSLHQTSSTAATGARTAPVGTPLAAASGGLDAEVAMPAGFPSDFPIYQHARLTAAAPFASPGQTAWGMEWQTVDATSTVEVAYPKQFAGGDWVLEVHANSGGDFTAAISRKSDQHFSGTLVIANDVAVTKILVSLIGPG